MKISYDFHIHSALSPCSDDTMTPCNIAAAASLNGLNAIAVTDHNAIANCKAAAEVCKALGIAFLYGIEVQTSEDIHVVALFDSYQSLEAFFNTLTFPPLKNRAEIFGRQLIYDSDDRIVGEEERMLLASCDEGIYDICARIIDMGGKAIPAHIDREANGILAILGEIPPDLPFSALEFSPYAPKELLDRYSGFERLINSDAHRPQDLMTGENTIEALSAEARDIWLSI